LNASARTRFRTRFSSYRNVVNARAAIGYGGAAHHLGVFAALMEPDDAAEAHLRYALDRGEARVALASADARGLRGTSERFRPSTRDACVGRAGGLCADPPLTPPSAWGSRRLNSRRLLCLGDPGVSAAGGGAPPPRPLRAHRRFVPRCPLPPRSGNERRGPRADMLPRYAGAEGATRQRRATSLPSVISGGSGSRRFSCAVPSFTRRAALDPRPRRSEAGPRHDRDREDLAYAGLTRQTELLRSKQISAPELTKLYLGRIESLDGKLNAGAPRRSRAARAAIADYGAGRPTASWAPFGLGTGQGTGD